MKKIGLSFRKIIIIASIFLLYTNGLSATCSYEQIEGTWSGELVESGTLMYNIDLTIDCNSGVQSQYSNGITCGGSWAINSNSGTTYIFRETITNGSGCVNSFVRVILNPDGTLSYTSATNTNFTGQTALGVLNRAQQASSVPTLSQWGLISLFLMLLIIGIVAIEYKKNKVSYIAIEEK